MADLSKLTKAQLLERKQLLEKKQQLLSKSAPTKDWLFNPQVGVGPFAKSISLETLAQPGSPTEAMGRTLQDIQTIPAHYINQAGFNLPRAIAHRLGTEYPETQNVAANIAAKTAGGFGAVTSPLTKALGIAKIGRYAPTTKLATKAGRSALSGAVGGAAYTPTEDIVGLQQRGEQAMLGAVGGLVAEVGGQVIARGTTAFRRLRKPQEPAGITVQKQIKKVKELKKAKRTNIIETFQDTKEVLRQNKDIMLKELDEATELGTKQFQDRLPEYFKANSEAYGQTLDDVSNTLAKSGRGKITLGEITDIVEQTLQEAREMNIPAGKLRALARKYALEYTNEAGDIVYQDAGKKLNFRKVLDDVRSLRKKLPTGVREGTRRFTEDDIVVSIFNKNWGQFVEQNVPIFAELQSQYAPVIQAMKMANRVFKPYQGKFKTSTGIRFLKAYGVKPNRTNMAFIKMLQEGGGFGKGVGQVTTPIRQKGVAISELGRKMQALQRQQQMSFRQLEKQYVSRVAMLGERQDFIAGLLRKKAQAETIRNWVMGTAGAGALYGLGYGAVRGLSRGVPTPP